MGEAEMTYAGPNALARAKLAIDVLKKRCQNLKTNYPIRFDILGTVSVHSGDMGPDNYDSFGIDGDYRVRIASKGQDKKIVERINQEMLSLYCSGPAGGGGFRQHLTDQIHTASILVDRDKVATKIEFI